MYSFAAHSWIRKAFCMLVGFCCSGSAIGQVLYESAKLSPLDPVSGDLFGGAVSVSTDVAIVGRPFESSNEGAGAAYIFRRTSGLPETWTQEQKLIASNGEPFDRFGFSASVSGDFVVVGAPYSRSDDRGSAYIFRWNPGAPGAWVLEQELQPQGTSGLFGVSVSISGNVAVVGIQAHEPISDTDNGAAYIFRRDFAGSEPWIQEQQLRAPEGDPSAFFGSSVSHSGNVVVVGAYRSDDFGTDSGAAYVFRRGPHTGWVLEQKLLADDGAPGDFFGWSVSVSGDLIGVGAYRSDASGSKSGAAYVFRWNGSAWVQEQKLLPADGATFDRFGHSVSVSGDAVLVGAFNDMADGVQSGSAFLFRWNPSTLTWVEQAKLLSSDGSAGDQFGIAVAVFDRTAVIGAELHDDNALDTGAAYVFELPCGLGRFGPMCLPCPGGADNPCQGHGSCDDGAQGTGACMCSAAWMGEDCGIDADECALGTDNCDANATCTNITGSFTCTCDVGYSGDGITCTSGAIPTVSTWGLAVLLLVLLVGAKVGFRRNPRVIE